MVSYFSPSFLYPALSKYHCDSGFIQRCSQGRFMMYGASDGVVMLAGLQVLVEDCARDNGLDSGCRLLLVAEALRFDLIRSGAASAAAAAPTTILPHPKLDRVVCFETASAAIRNRCSHTLTLVNTSNFAAWTLLLTSVLILNLHLSPPFSTSISLLYSLTAVTFIEAGPRTAQQQERRRKVPIPILTPAWLPAFDAP